MMSARIPRFVAAGLLALAVALLTGPAIAWAGVNVIVNNVDPPGIGFNDPTLAAPVGGNPGTTLGQQRLIAFQFAADVWGSILDSDVDVVVQATFSPLACTPNAGTLGAAGTIQIFAGFPGAQFPNTWYHSALANKLAGFDLTPGPPDPGLLVPPFNDDIVAFFNGDIDTDPNCLTGLTWYYGLDASPPPGTLNFVSVLLHEMAHGLGFQNFITEATGAGPLGLPDIYTVYSLDNTTGLHWNQMTDAERVASGLNCRNVAWDGPNVTAQVPSYLAPGTPVLNVSSPASVAGSYPVGPASFGPPLSSPGVTGDLVLVDDGVGPNPADACEPLTPASAAAVAGKVALVDRGQCAFVLKVFYAEAAGATAVVVADNVAGCPPAGLGGAGPIGIPSARITLADGTAIKAALPGVNVTLGVDLSRRSGADANGHLLLFATDPVQAGSSISHWETLAFPNLLMEPFITASVLNNVDVTPYLLVDEGWSFMTVMIDGCDTGVDNEPLPGGGLISDLVDACAASAANHGDFVSCITHLGNQLQAAGYITGAQNGSLTSCAGGAGIP